MKRLTDEEIQKLLEEGQVLPAPEEDREKAYPLLFAELKKEPREGLPYGFAEGVVSHIKMRQRLRAGFWFYVKACLAAFGAAGLIAFVCYLARPDFFTGIIMVTPDYTGGAGLLLFVVILMKYVDFRVLAGEKRTDFHG